MLLYILLLVAGMISTGILALSVFTVSEPEDNPFKDGQLIPGLLKCLCIVVATNLLALVPEVGGWLSLGAWFVGIMAAFQMTFGKSFIILLVNVFFMVVLSYGVNQLTARLAA